MIVLGRLLSTNKFLTRQKNDLWKNSLNWRGIFEENDYNCLYVQRSRKIFFLQNSTRTSCVCFVNYVVIFIYLFIFMCKSDSLAHGAWVGVQAYACVCCVINPCWTVLMSVEKMQRNRLWHQQ